MKININTSIAFTYLISRRKQTIVAALGVTFGISMFIFMNSLITGSNEWSEKIMLGSTPHLRLYRDYQMNDHRMLNRFIGDRTVNLISNPQPVNTTNKIINPDGVVNMLTQYKEVMSVSKQVNSSVIYSHGNITENGTVFGVNILEQDKMFDISSTMISGSTAALAANQNGIILGIGLAEKLNVQKGDYVIITVGQNAFKRLEVVGIFKTTIKGVDNTKSYVAIPIVQQLLHQDRNFITDIYIHTNDYNQTANLSASIKKQSGYAVETWQNSNEQSLAGKKIRDIIANAVVITILIVAGFGIYNILNMVIYEKIKEIAILKATGFQGKHVIQIFISQALFIGIIGVCAGLLAGWLLSYSVSKMYIGLGNLTYLPISFHAKHYVQGAIFGMITAFLAGYIPAVRAAKVDPVAIIRG